ncbi:nitrous oxidase accessory protein [Robiginitalea myxolifaciens]|uniref:Nitrous oxidase accessory protein n=2 Tax=Robiginitalea myxolifaciens TaxID=400055 RepID=A0A1I6FYD7_9FLAO|nr:nitrous oxidase accessory protein [Robiginitalea myxolifaciens]
MVMMAQNVTGKTLTICQNCAINTIEEGIALAQSGDTLRVERGTYREYNLFVDKPLTIVGIDTPVIDGQKRGEIFRITADNVSIIGLKIINVGVSYTSDHAAIRIVKSEGFNVSNNELEQLFFGIFLEKSSRGRIANNRISGVAKDEYNSGNGIHIWYSKNVDVQDNTVEGVRDGIYLEFSDSVHIRSNKSRKNLRYGLHFMFSNHNFYGDNTFENNGAGVAVMFSKFIEMRGNHFSKNWGPASYGMLLKEITDATISDNIFEENTVGINIEGSNRIVYERNQFIQNGWAIKVLGACYSNTFRSNNFLYNSFDLSYNSRMNDNLFEGNYWSNYSGYDLDKDGIGDIPHRPVKLFSYVVNRTPETLILLRSLFMDIIDFSERVSPVFTPDNLADTKPLMRKVE